MSYLDSIEYKESKKQLVGEYKDTFHQIESFYLAYDGKKYEAILTLSLIMDSFLEAQASKKPIEKITGGNTKKYAIELLNAEYDRHQTKYDFIKSIVMYLFIILIVITYKTFIIHPYATDTLTQKMNHLTFGICECSLIIYTLIYTSFKKFLIQIFYDKKWLGKALLSLPYICLMLILNRFGRVSLEDNTSPFNIEWFTIPFPLFIVLFTLTAVSLIFLLILGKKYDKRIELREEFEHYQLAEVTCLTCGNEYDYDYPKCPYCGSVNESV
ncbi:hypothetical protein [Anaeromicropila herbilytica]|uniref:Uncharacterized protein n=1 Tax=Anaeromicropila herbilytica TaxID=2785025 RepID=A0A7R7EK32_9FIRM|nr:hypothetical protein [Anaeromicropila herbilytica]BCN30194.1 hypothetical protein bsdtb5_14890 [Anaeromicropila herbilytica]